jgi:type II secretory pathway component GspD/PulD (secretin)
VFGPGCVGSHPEGTGEAEDSLLETLAEVEGAQPSEVFDEDAYLAALEAEYAEAEAPAPQDAPEISPYLEFGGRIEVYDSGFIAKPYFFPVSVGQKALDMLRDHAGLRLHTVSTDGTVEPREGPQPPDSVALHLLNEFDKEAFSNPRSINLVAPKPIAISDMLLVTAKADQLRAVEAFLRTFISSVRQIEIEAKIVEVTTRRTFDFGIRPIDSSTPIFGLPSAGSLVNSVDFSFGNSVDASEAIFQVSSVFDGVEFNALLEAVATREDVSIISRPKVAVREGARAEIRNTLRIPFFQVKAINANGNFTTTLDFQDVGVQMYVIPTVIGRDTVILNIDVEASQQTGTAVALTQGSGDNLSVVAVPEISTRRATTTVRLDPGQAVILGGLITERSLERERKIPVLGDIPLLGNLFKSTFTESQQTTVLFFIRPRILQGIDLDAEGF